MERVITTKTNFGVAAQRNFQALDNSAVADKSVIIVGAGLGGLSAAIHLRLQGFQVTIFESNPKVGGRANIIEQDGFRFDTGPSLLNYPWVFRQLFEVAGRRLEDYVELIPVDPAIAFQWEDGTRFQLSSDFTRLADECERLEPGSRIGLLSFLRDAAEKYRISFTKLINQNQDNPIKWISGLTFKEITKLGIWKSLDTELKKFFKSEYIRQALGSYGMYLGGSPYQLPGLFTILAYGELAYGLWLPKGGIYGLVEGIEKLALELGVKICTGTRVKKINITDKKVTGITLDDDTVYSSSIVISNVDVPTTNSKLLPAGLTSKRSNNKFGKNKMTPGVITFYWGLKGEVSNIGHHTIFLPTNYSGAFKDLFNNKVIPADLPFYVSIPSATDPSLAPENHSAMFVLIPTPLLSELGKIDWESRISNLKSQIFARLRQHGIEISSEQIVLERIMTPENWAGKFGLYDGSAFGLAHRVFQVGPFRPRNFSTEITGLYYTGASTTPGTGMPMVVLSGKLVAERILAKVTN